jgi:hypothetical protein
MGVISFTTLPLHPQGNIPSFPLYRRLGMPQHQSRCYRKEKHFLPLKGIKTWFLGCPTHYQITTQAELCQIQRKMKMQHTSYVHIFYVQYTVVCRPVARQWPQNKRDMCCCCAVASAPMDWPVSGVFCAISANGCTQNSGYSNRETVFSVQSVPRHYMQDK